MDVVEQLRDVAPDALAGQGVAFAYLFGSHAAGTATGRSDVDVAVHLTDDIDDHHGIRSRLAGLLERATGLGPVEVVLLDDAPLALAGRIREHGRLFMRNDEVARVRWESLVALMYHDFDVHERRTTRERLARLAAN